VKLWQEEGRVRAEGAHIFQEMKNLCLSFQDFKFLLIGREANGAAYRCAKEALGDLVHTR
jgi:hypothetical protein